jgi:hypothetical protein
LVASSAHKIQIPYTNNKRKATSNGMKKTKSTTKVPSDTMTNKEASSHVFVHETGPFVDPRITATGTVERTVERDHTTMTRFVKLRHPPLDESHKKKALQYIKWCEGRKDGETYKNFEKQIKDYIASINTREEKFTHTFVEYVMLEAISRNIKSLAPKMGLYTSFRFNVLRSRLIRQECNDFWRTSPVQHAKFYQNTINDALINAGICPTSFTCFWEKNNGKDRKGSLEFKAL